MERQRLAPGRGTHHFMNLLRDLIAQRCEISFHAFHEKSYIFLHFLGCKPQLSNRQSYHSQFLSIFARAHHLLHHSPQIPSDSAHFGTRHQPLWPEYLPQTSFIEFLQRVAVAEKFIEGKRARAFANDAEDVLFTEQSGAGVQSCCRDRPRRRADHGDF